MDTCTKKITCGDCPANQWVKCPVAKRKAHIASVCAKS